MYNQNARRVLFPGESEKEEDSWDGDLEEIAVRNDNSKKTFWHNVNNGTNTKSNEEAGKGLPKPPAYIFDTHRKTDLDNKKRKYATPDNSATAEQANSNEEDPFFNKTPEDKRKTNETHHDSPSFMLPPTPPLLEVTFELFYYTPEKLKNNTNNVEHVSPNKKNKK